MVQAHMNTYEVMALSNCNNFVLMIFKVSTRYPEVERWQVHSSSLKFKNLFRGEREIYFYVLFYYICNIYDREIVCVN